MRTEPNNKRKQQMQTTNASNKRKQQTLPLMGARRPASGKAAAIILVEFVFPFFLYPAGRVAPICACVHWLHSLRLLPDGKSFLSVIIRQSTNA